MKNRAATIYYNPECPYCHHAIEFFARELPTVKLDAVALNHAPGAAHDKFIKALERCGLTSMGIPLIIAGGTCFQGFDERVATEIRDILSH